MTFRFNFTLRSHHHRFTHVNYDTGISGGEMLTANVVEIKKLIISRIKYIPIYVCITVVTFLFASSTCAEKNNTRTHMHTDSHIPAYVQILSRSKRTSMVMALSDYQLYDAAP